MQTEKQKYISSICQITGISCLIPFGQYFINLAYATGDISIKAFLLSFGYLLFGIIVLMVGGNYCAGLDE